jgi:two-component system response regulator RegX3
VKVDNARLELRRTEYKLLCYFVKNQGLLLRRTQILNALWDSSEEYVDDRTLTVAISRLRERLRFFNTNVNIETVRGIGYRLTVKDYLQ